MPPLNNTIYYTEKKGFVNSNFLNISTCGNSYLLTFIFWGGIIAYMYLWKGVGYLAKRFIPRATCAFLFFCLLFTALIFAVSASNDDYSYPAAVSVENIYADEFLSNFTDIELCAVEGEYLRQQSGFLISYNNTIPTYAVKTTYENGILTVFCEEYVYTASNGIDVIWTPIFAELEGEQKNFGAAPYILFFSAPSADSEEKVKVEYESKIVIKKETVGRLFNLAYADAPRLEVEIEEKKQEYERLSTQYATDREKYNEYLSLLAEYNAYLSLKRIYDDKYAEYVKYLSEKSDYEIAKAAYDNYVLERDKYYVELAKYTEYLAYAEQNLAKIEEYERYQEKNAVVLAQLDVIKQTKSQLTPLKRTVYDAIMGETVTSVINRKGDIVKVLGANAKVVDIADVATKNLRVLLKEFFEIKTTEEQYKYYITNYEAFRDNFANLLVALDDLYLNAGVRGAMIAEEKHEKYLILVAQLYYVANALSDEPIKSYNGKYYFDSSYKIGSSYSSDKQSTPSVVINNEPFVVDTGNAAPLADGYPIEPEKPEYTLMQEPVLPKPVVEPIAPEYVEEPKMPPAVSEPKKITNPGKEPQPPFVPDEVAELIDAYNRGEIQERKEYSGGDVTVSARISVYKFFAKADEVLVTYYDREYNANGPKEILYTVTVDRNTPADYLGDIPNKDEDSEYVYVHNGWSDSEGREVDLTCVSHDVDVYPTFSAKEKEYETVWVVGDEIYYENPGIPPIPTGEFYYDFSRWERIVDKKTNNVKYTAVYDSPLVKAGNEAVKVHFEDGNYVVEPRGVSNKFDISALLHRASGTGGIIIKTPLGEQISISYSDTVKMKNADVSAIGYSASALSNGGYAYRLFVYGSDGQEVKCNAKIGFVSPCDIADNPHFKIYSVEDGEKVFLRNMASSGFVSFSAVAGNLYYARNEYSLNSVPLEAVKILLSQDAASAGTLIGISLDSLGGIRVDGIYLMSSDGEKTYVEKNSFIMPADDITVGVDYTVLRYKITFVSNGKTIVTYYCNYGDVITLPTNPKKAPNEKYSFAFERWSPAISDVTGDATYSAVYSSTPIPQNEKTMEITPSVLKLLMLAVVGVCCFVLVVLPSVIMTLILLKKRKKKFLHRKR